MKQGSLGEIAVQKEFIKLGIEVYSPITDNTSYDMLVNNKGKILKVEVKSTSRFVEGAYRVGIRRVRSNKKENKVYNFDNESVDILAVYVIPEDKVILYKASDLKVKTEIKIMDDDLRRSVALP